MDNPQHYEAWMASFCNEYGWPEPVRVPGCSTRFITRAVIPPDAAEDILNHHHIDNNRHIKKSVYRFSEDMKRGVWFENAHAIAFDKTGKLYDGQHRLGACVRSGEPFTTLVVFGVEQVGGTDKSVSRTLRDDRKMRGEPTTQVRISTARRTLVGDLKMGAKEVSRVSDAIVDEAVDLLTDGIDVVESAIQTNVRGITTVPFRAVMVRAFYAGHETELRRFCAILCGQASALDNEVAAQSLMVSLINNQRRHHVGDQGQREHFRRTATAFKAFVEKRPLQKIYSTPGNEYPVPECVRHLLPDSADS
ncbi:hypothetical protein [Stratiformator vulcanicus]|uniref:ParB-like nuclease domain protein n=1 Tax=Stratiformator vulcanicus TaxID=2527980 RepID=A0A517R7G6_9PLAN|nr:hypothetical protein [Stratiformator vulcanicus]QDT39761.1 hypothetical protein Pan189_41700 [Stratiformator vulcanicus]